MSDESAAFQRSISRTGLDFASSIALYDSALLRYSSYASLVYVQQNITSPSSRSGKISLLRFWSCRPKCDVDPCTWELQFPLGSSLKASGLVVGFGHLGTFRDAWEKLTKRFAGEH